MRELWETGHSDFKGAFFQMDDCRLSPKPEKAIQIVGAAQSDNGTRFAAETCDYNFCGSFGINEPTRVAASVARLVAAADVTGRDVGALILTMVIADETDAAAMAKWEHYKAGVDLEAIAWRDSQAGEDPSKDAFATKSRLMRTGSEKLPTSMGVLVG